VLRGRFPDALVRVTSVLMQNHLSIDTIYSKGEPKNEVSCNTRASVNQILTACAEKQGGFEFRASCLYFQVAYAAIAIASLIERG